MAMDFGGESIADPVTFRGRDWPCLRQFGVFLENRVGRLHDLLRSVERHDLRVMALSIVDSVDCAVVRLVLNNYERGRELLELSGFPMFESDVIGVVLPDDPQPHMQICSALLRAEVNIHYTYPLLYRRNGRGSVALYVDDVDQGLQILTEGGFAVVTENDLLEYDDFLS